MKDFFKKIIRGIVESGIYIYAKLLFRLKIEGRENIPKEGALIYCGNHRSYLDPQLIVSTAKRHVHFMGKESLKKNPILRFLAWCFDGIYVKRDAKDISALKEALKVLKKGGCVAIFPEGTRNGVEKGEKVKGGAAFFAVKTGAKVIPVGVSGEEKLFHRVTIRYGKPLDFKQYTDVKNKEELDKVTEEIMKNIFKLCK